MGADSNQKMPIAKKILITTDSQEVVIVRKAPEGAIIAFCKNCTGDAKFLTLDNAVEVTGISGGELIGLITANSIHILETARGRLFICQESLKSFEK